MSKARPVTNPDCLSLNKQFVNSMIPILFLLCIAKGGCKKKIRQMAPLLISTYVERNGKMNRPEPCHQWVNVLWVHCLVRVKLFFLSESPALLSKHESQRVCIWVKFCDVIDGNVSSLEKKVLTLLLFFLNRKGRIGALRILNGSNNELQLFLWY